MTNLDWLHSLSAEKAADLILQLSSTKSVVNKKEIIEWFNSPCTILKPRNNNDNKYNKIKCAYCGKPIKPGETAYNIENTDYCSKECAVLGITGVLFGLCKKKATAIFDKYSMQYKIE